MKVIRKPVELNAIQFTGDRNAVFDLFYGPQELRLDPADHITIMSVNGFVIAKIGDWIIELADGHIGVCKQETFEKNYEVAK